MDDREGASKRMEGAPEEGRLIGKLSPSEFTAANLLLGSVYLWACDEAPTGDDRPSRSDAWVAWVVLIVREKRRKLFQLVVCLFMVRLFVLCTNCFESIDRITFSSLACKTSYIIWLSPA